MACRPTLDGLAGNDHIDGFGGNDLLCGGDTANGGPGFDSCRAERRTACEG